MSSISSITKAVSGLVTAQKGLQITGHNISNTNTEGYTRQQLLQSDSSYLKVGEKGGYSLQVGLGVTNDEIRQIRDDLADKRLRTENSVLCYYQTLNTVSSDVESIFDEPYGNTVSDLISDFWSQAQKLSTAPDGVEERLSFISTAKVLMGKINNVSSALNDYQEKLNSDLAASVNKVNQVLEDIRTYNEKIAIAEANGEAANDYRDQRNLLLDELSTYGNISYDEEADARVQVKFEGHMVINKGFEIELELSEIENSPYSQITWSDSKQKVFDLTTASSSNDANHSGLLKAILIARGNNKVTEETTWDEIALNDHLSVDVSGNAFVIPKIQKMLSEFTTTLVELVNDSFTGTGMGSYKGVKGVQFFVPINNPDGELVPGNIQVNPELLEQGGYNKLGTVAQTTGTDGKEEIDGNIDNTSDNTLIKQFLEDWSNNKDWFKEGDSLSAPFAKSVTLTDFFSELVTDMGSEGSIYAAKASEKYISVTNIENERQAMGGVSTDEEFSNMLKYQYAYNASARMITMLDGMLDTIINKM